MKKTKTVKEKKEKEDWNRSSRTTLDASSSGSSVPFVPILLCFLVVPFPQLQNYYEKNMRDRVARLRNTREARKNETKGIASYFLTFNISHPQP